MSTAGHCTTEQQNTCKAGNENVPRVDGEVAPKRNGVIVTASHARGVLFVHSSPRALCPHIEWAAGRALNRAVNFTWDAQPVLKGSQRAEFYWEGPRGTGARLASALRGWEHLRYEVTEDAGLGTDGGRWMHTPDLGIFYAQTDTAGNMVIPEDRLRYAMDIAGANAVELHRELRLALGQAWDEELEVFRHASQDSAVVWLHKVG